MNASLTKASAGELKPRKPLCLDQYSTVADAIRCMRNNQSGCVLITESDHLVGMVTERDILKELISKNISSDKTYLKNLMSRDPDYLFEEDSAAFALNMMSVGGYRNITVLNMNGIPSGILAIEDILDHIIEKMNFK